eukprot:CAMPEP_0176144088 /NCGR_PEP_ID=MMETSP0120_2-20121206/73349_1 /TAXON_ID=160619 /ORGANISM="Kryptoperidinium foliaceum, Strain CCMP 1326" /LENGTH=59 /DNA_ID=CAMNT_0017480431 /DNA_START=155 /DNA_END=331 /DNA_ORIENTATION=+
MERSSFGSGTESSDQGGYGVRQGPPFVAQMREELGLPQPRNNLDACGHKSCRNSSGNAY